MMPRRKLTREQQRQIDALNAIRDELGRIHCMHGTPGGSEKCPLCRRAVLRAHEGWHEPKGSREYTAGAIPMPAYVRDALAHPERWAPQPTTPPLPLDGEPDA